MPLFHRWSFHVHVHLRGVSFVQARSFRIRPLPRAPPDRRARHSVQTSRRNRRRRLGACHAQAFILCR